MTTKREYTGGSVSYYKVDVGNPISGNPGYTAECNDIIEALGMNYAEGNAFKAIWRSCAAKTLGVSKSGYTDGLYDAEKVRFFGGRMVAIAKAQQATSQPATPAYTDLKEVADHMNAVAAAKKAVQECDCIKCDAQRHADAKLPLFGGKMTVCAKCGNKRCPKAQDHKFKCSGSNDVGQVGVLEAADDGWIEWGGGIIPVGGLEWIEVKAIDGNRGFGRAGDFLWGHGGIANRIVAYRIAKEQA